MRMEFGFNGVPAACAVLLFGIALGGCSSAAFKESTTTQRAKVYGACVREHNGGEGIRFSAHVSTEKKFTFDDFTPLEPLTDEQTVLIRTCYEARAAGIE
ncbi:hypothetical protein C8N35_103214 [Breoghania corrubedonensis]|uniref:Lipoprotein n=1 Tax=Breoghania corrubedonensis TaxID=665038 RepID=A0A2T5VB99_9HYPH|nr:hypothetical protein [Breoghania corrubedonensis]PTW61032.1 hypothetical protein C8N35_103214 [Breoghania corrubedonensis]